LFSVVKKRAVCLGAKAFREGCDRYGSCGRGDDVRVMRRSGWFCVNSRNDDAFGSRLSREGRSSDGGREIKTILYIFVAFQGISIVNSIIESRNAKTLELSSSGVSSVIGLAVVVFLLVYHKHP
jgi:hypothetical protein